MNASRYKLPVWLLGIAALGTLTGFAIHHRNSLIESWHLFRLGSGSPESRQGARESLIRIASVKAVPRFIAPEQDAAESAGAAREILKQLDGPAMVRLGEILRREEDRLHLQVVALHREAHGPPAPLADFLKVALGHPNPGVRRYAAEELVRLGSEAESALPQLLRARDDACEEVRFWAGLAFQNLKVLGLPSG
jgi:hypothetical protein